MRGRFVASCLAMLFIFACSPPPKDSRTANITPEELFYRALAQQKAEKYDDAILSYQEVLNLNPNHAKSHYNLGMIYAFQLHDKEKALVHFDRFLSLDINSERAASTAKVMCSLDLPSQVGDEDEQKIIEKAKLKKSQEVKRRIYLEALEKNPNSVVLLYLVGESYRLDEGKKGNVKKAMEYYQKALEVRPTCSMCHLALGRLLIDQNQSEEGGIHLRKGELFSVVRR